MRICSNDYQHKLTIIDRLCGGEKHVLYHRSPTTEERQRYEHAKVCREGDDVQLNATTAALEGGMAILTGIREGDFGQLDTDGEAVTFASDPESKAYDPDWKELVAAHASDHLIHLGLHVFENPTAVERAPAKAPPRKKKATTRATSS